MRLGLRGQSLLAMVLSGLLALLPALWLGWKVIDGVRGQLGTSYARNTVLLKREQVAGLLSRELALSQRQARSEATRRWMLAEGDAERRATFWREAESFRQDFSSRAFSVTPLASLDYYYVAGADPAAQRPVERLDAGAAKDSWFFNTVRSEQPYNINVDLNQRIGAVRVWINVKVFDQDQVIGVAGASLDLAELTQRLVDEVARGQKVLVVNRAGAIQIAQDRSLIAMNSGTQGGAERSKTLDALLGSTEQVHAFHDALAQAERSPGSAQVIPVSFNQVPVLLATAFIPELNWHVVSTIDLSVAPLLNLRDLTLPLLALCVLGVALFGGIALSVERLILRPLNQLKHAAQAMAAGQFEVSPPPAGTDEIGDLTRAFTSMATRVRGHTESLEAEVRARTAELEAANQAMQQAHRAINDSIDYARLIQRAILPDRLLARQLGGGHFVLWQPRDVVGGDFYVFHASANGFLLGVIDCAGHGVPGALMTMLARAAMDRAIEDVGLTDPAAIIGKIDGSMRAMLEGADIPHSIATSMDAGLVYVDQRTRQARFAGAKVSMFYSDGQSVNEIKPSRRAINEKRRGSYVNVDLPLAAGTSYYLVTDGYLDQAGGEHGFGFGHSRFAELLRQHAALAPAEQREAFLRSMRNYQGDYPQRDDVTVMCFRVDETPHPHPEKE